MEAQTAIVFTRVGLILDFLAFFLAAPEILGEERLKKILATLRVFLWWTAFSLFLMSLGGIILLIISIQISIFEIAKLSIETFFSIPSTFELPLLEFLPSLLLIVVLSSLTSWLPMPIMKIGEILSSKKKARQLSLIVGILFFISSAIAQFIGTF